MRSPREWGGGEVSVVVIEYGPSDEGRERDALSYSIIGLDVS